MPKASPPTFETPWAEGHSPHAQTLNPLECTVEELGAVRCRSFKADFLHKLLVILRAHGGWKYAVKDKVAARLGVSHRSFDRWIAGQNIPPSSLFERIDNIYFESVDDIIAKRPPKDVYAEHKTRFDHLLGRTTIAHTKRKSAPRIEKPTGILSHIVNAKWSDSELTSMR